MKNGKKMIWILLGLAIMAGIVMMPTPAGLSVAGQRVLAVLTFAVIMWVTEAVSYPFSALAIILFLILFLGFAPVHGVAGPLLKTGKAIPIALSGFVNGGWVLVAAGLFMAAGILGTGLEKRIALNILKIVGAKTKAIFAGMMIVMLVLGFLIPSITARSATMTPIAMGLIAAFGVDPRSVFARNMLVTVAIASSISGIGLLSAGAPNPVAVSFISSQLKHSITWGEWLIYGMPFCIVLMVIFYFLVTRLNKFEFDEIPGGRAAIDKALAELGPMSGKEKRIAVIFIITILLWATDFWHHIDANTVSILSVTLMMMPYLGVASWKEMSSRVDWGTILLFGAGISLGEALLKSGAAIWLAKTALGGMGLGSMAAPVMMTVIAVALLIIRFAFASITSATAALVPTVLGFLISLGDANLPMWGMTFIATMTVYFAFILPVNSPQGMVPYATNTFEVKDMAKVGIPLTIIGFAVLILFMFTYWHWLGLV
ncbi:sodium/sulphate symporter [Lucifera butyrica]|uniref:Sodium-dependent dicarboxylate transporter SdcS n=1 Tax=Lucifera butyrica TaxID=1351585 RepID=A0A498RG85_9FIRM|nr:DASS family sodium-coupled anion symporter [Lucifera butyrica]VBB09820.1 sodium/sulphate symporter [Lucifera butyrica]